MTKIDIIRDVSNKLGFSKKDSARFAETVLEVMKETFAHGEKIMISGFGSFVVSEKKARKERNPQTGEEIDISAREVLTFRPSPALKKILNG